MIFIVIAVIIIIAIVCVLVFKSKPDKNNNLAASETKAAPKPVSTPQTNKPTVKNKPLNPNSIIFSMKYKNEFGLKNSSAAYRKHPLALAKLNVNKQEDKATLLTVVHSTGIILKDIAPSGMAHGIMGEVLRNNEDILNKLKQRIPGLNRTIKQADMSYGEFLKKFDCTTYGEVAGLQRVCTIKLAKAGFMEAGPKDRLQDEYDGLLNALNL